MQPYFSFEKDLWTDRDGASLTLNRFERFLDGPAVSRGPKGSPDEKRVEAPNVVRHQGRFAMYYTAMRPPPEDAWQASTACTTCIAYSDDGIHWEKPDLGLMKGISTGGAPNNVLPELSHKIYGTGVMPNGDGQLAMSIFYPREIPIEEGQTTFSIMTSEDGVHWNGARKPCNEVQHFEGSSSMFKFRGKYWVLGQGVSPYFKMPDGRPCGRVMFAYSSKDLKTWRLHKQPAYAYPIPKYFREAAVQNHTGAFPMDRGRIALGIMGQFWPAGFSEVVRSTFGLIYTYDGTKWDEPFVAEPLLLPQESGWECGMLVQGGGLFSRNDTSYYYYAGFDGGNLWAPCGAAGCVRIRRDGFAHFIAADSSATVQTAPISLSKNDQTIYVNAQVTANSPIRVELLDGNGKHKLASADLKQSGVLVPAITLDPRKHKNVSLRFRLSGKAKLYAFYAGPSVDPEAYLSDWKEG